MNQYLHPKAVYKMAVLFPLLVGLAACGNNNEQINNAASVLADYYKGHPPDRGWKVKSIAADSQTNQIIVEVTVTSESDVKNIKALSRMEQFAVAKLACPKLTPQINEALGSNIRTWVHLLADGKELTSSICPHG